VKLRLWIFIKDCFESMVVIVMLCIITNCLYDLFVQLLGLGTTAMICLSKGSF
jgi:hypothetical protein